MSTYLTDQQKAYRLFNPKRRRHAEPEVTHTHGHVLFQRLMKSPAYLREDKASGGRLIFPVLTRWHAVFERRRNVKRVNPVTRKKNDAPHYVEIDEGHWVLRYLDENLAPQTHVLELEWHQLDAEGAHRAACLFLDVGGGDVDIRQ